MPAIAQAGARVFYRLSTAVEHSWHAGGSTVSAGPSCCIASQHTAAGHSTQLAAGCAGCDCDCDCMMVDTSGPPRLLATIPPSSQHRRQPRATGVD
eukprot:COSAG01_NODE_379_length_17872_cov_8.030102_4_plen_96_part_00